MKIAALIATIAAAAISTVSAQSGTFTNFTTCAAPDNNGQLTVTKLALSPFPLCIKQKYCLAVTGSLSAPLVEGAALQNVWRFYSRDTPQDYDLCSLLAAGGRPCPIDAGPVSFNLCFDALVDVFPPNFPVGWSYNAYNGDGSLLFCSSAPPNTARTEETPENPYGIAGIYAQNCA
ncbi:hypothetical protein BG015_000670 [Linnemannia schmuckeri]|uniref:Uncharacterized protein n=1 Tax=Linnemannia schmuckeri TaxID=64567 RepID=A0A9P5RT75_9FUNG|nr:hypothetical protein BG015_000670 [Linnemannia schmuckeri]